MVLIGGLKLVHLHLQRGHRKSRPRLCQRRCLFAGPARFRAPRRGRVRAPPPPPPPAAARPRRPPAAARSSPLDAPAPPASNLASPPRLALRSDTHGVATPH